VDLDEVRQIETWPFNALIVIGLASVYGICRARHPGGLLQGESADFHTRWWRLRREELVPLTSGLDFPE
jgi:hypothetical protein